MEFCRFITISLMIISLLSSCTEKNESSDISVDTDILELEYTEKHIDYTINEFPLTVQANCQWGVKCKESWLEIQPRQSQYKNSVVLHFRAQNNTSTEPRVAEVVFTYGDKTSILTITQEPFEVYLRASEEQISIGYRAAEKTIRINSNCGWYAKADQDWIAIKPSTGLIGTFDMLIKVETNTNAKARSGQIKIWNDTYGTDIFIRIDQGAGGAANNNKYIDENGNDLGPGIVISGLVWAPVNCGYDKEKYPYGKMFQWGRKYGLGYTDDTFRDASANIITDIWQGANGHESPDAFYLSSEKSRFGYDWILEGNDGFWNLGTEVNPIKNKEFDPCPEGWRIPTAYEFRQLSDNSSKEWRESEGIKGLMIKDEESLFLPAGGRINISDGLCYDRNVEGYYWSITTAEAGSSSYLYFHKENCSVNNLGSRAGACLVRCIKV